MVSSSGHGADGVLGDGIIQGIIISIKFYDNSGTELTGANYPKITNAHRVCSYYGYYKNDLTTVLFLKY